MRYRNVAIPAQAAGPGIGCAAGDAGAAHVVDVTQR